MPTVSTLSPSSAVYIAGPMTGVNNFNYPAFWLAASKYRAHGIAVFNPADLPLLDGWESYMRASLTMLAKATHIHLLPNWELSKGANLERLVADNLGIAVSDCPCVSYDCKTCEDYFAEHEPAYNEASFCTACNEIFVDHYGTNEASEKAGNCCQAETGGTYVCCVCESELVEDEVKTRCYECHMKTLTAFAATQK